MLPFVFIVLMFISSSCGENPAVQFILTNKGLQYGKHVGAGWIQDKLAAVTLPEISGEIYIIFGHLHYELTDVTITKCDFPEPVVEFYEDATGFKTSIPGLSIAVTGDWMTEFGIIQSSGSFNMALFSVDVTSLVEMGMDPDRRLSVTSVGCNAQVGGVDMEFSGGVSWIYNHFEELYNERIKEEIKEKICQYVEESIVNLESHLQAMNVSFDVNQDIAVDLPLTGVPAIGASSVNVGFKGEFYSTKTHADPPFKPQQFTVPEQLNYMLSLGISEFTLNSASYGYYSAGLLQRVINDSMIPSYSPVRLNTSSMGPFIPKLPELYPGLLMTLQVYATDVPLFSFQPGAVQLDLNVDIKAFAIQPNGTQTPLFKLNAGSTFNAKVWTADGRLKASVGMNNLTLTLASSEIGPFKTDALQRLAKMGATAAIAKANEWLGKGIELPRMKYAELVNTVLEVEKGFIAIYADAQVLQKEGDFN